jgi:integrase
VQLPHSGASLAHLGTIKLPALKPEHVEQWKATLLASGLSPRTVLHAHRVLSRVLNRAMKNGTLTRNEAAICKPPRVEDKALEILEPEEASALLKALEGGGNASR